MDIRYEKLLDYVIDVLEVSDASVRSKNLDLIFLVEKFGQLSIINRHLPTLYSFLTRYILLFFIAEREREDSRKREFFKHISDSFKF